MKELQRLIEGANIVEICEIISEGTTMPVKCILQDGRYCVAKYPRNPFGTLVLLNEWIGACIADILNIPSPEYGISEFSEELILKTNQNEEIDTNNAGKVFFTVFYPDVIPLRANLVGDYAARDLCRVMVYDTILNDVDRHNGNALWSFAKGHRGVLFIDNSHILADYPWTPESYRKELCQPLNKRIIPINADCYGKLWRGSGLPRTEILEEAGKVKAELEHGDAVDAILSRAPEEWKNCASGEMLPLISEVLGFRIENIEGIIDSTIREMDAGEE